MFILRLRKKYNVLIVPQAMNNPSMIEGILDPERSMDLNGVIKLSKKERIVPFTAPMTINALLTPRINPKGRVPIALLLKKIPTRSRSKRIRIGSTGLRK